MTTDLAEDQPLVPFESQILECHAGRLAITELLRSFMDTQVVIPSAAPAVSLQAIEPLMWPHDGANLVGVFTHPDRAIEFADMVPNIAQMSGRKAITIINTGVGLLVNPGSQSYSFVIPPVAVESMRREFGT